MGYKDSFKEVVIKGTIYDSGPKLHDPLVPFLLLSSCSSLTVFLFLAAFSDTLGSLFSLHEGPLQDKHHGRGHRIGLLPGNIDTPSCAYTVLVFVYV